LDSAVTISQYTLPPILQAIQYQVDQQVYRIPNPMMLELEEVVSVSRRHRPNPDQAASLVLASARMQYYHNHVDRNQQSVLQNKVHP
jgi:hypothetical protein